MYCTFDQYKAMGGKLEQAGFDTSYIEAKFKIEYWTQDRVKTFDGDGVDAPEWLQYSMRVIIDMIKSIDDAKTASLSAAIDGDTLSSYSNGVETFGFASATMDQTVQYARAAEQTAYRKVVEAAPAEFVSWAVA